MVLFFFKIFYFRVIGNHTNNGMSLQNESYTPHLKKSNMSLVKRNHSFFFEVQHDY